MSVAVFVSAIAISAACTPQPNPGPGGDPSVSGSVSACAAGLSMSIDVDTAGARTGVPLGISAEIRNDPTGTCTATLGGTQVAGSVRVNGGSTGLAIDSIGMWLEAAGTRQVLPASLQLTTSGAGAPGACPAGVCDDELEATAGGVDYPSGLPSSVAAGSAIDVPFRFFPALAAADVASIGAADGSADLVVAVTSGTQVRLWRRTIQFTDAPAVTAATAAVSVGSSTLGTRSIPGPIAPGAQVDLLGAWSYTVLETDPDSLTVNGMVTAAGASSGSANLLVPVEGAGTPAPLAPSALPDAVTSGITTPVTFTVAPVGAVTGALQLAGPGIATTLLDDGTAGDLSAGDGVFSRSTSVALTTSTAFTVGGVVAGQPASATVGIEVLPAGAPTVPASWTGGPTVTDMSGEYLADRIAVTFSTNTAWSSVSSAATAVGGSVAGRLGRDVWQVRIPAVTSRAQLDGVLTAISGRPGVIGAEPDAVAGIDATEPNDPRFTDQWGFEAINAPDAWAFQRGGVLVAVVDTGVDLTHPDLDGQLRGTGRDFVNDDNNADDDDGHGTHVAGTIAAETDNSTLVSGTSWGSRILPVKVLDENGRGAITDIAAGIRWAVDRGARVINLSLGGTTRSEDYARAIDHAVDRNRVVVAAAGNDNCPDRYYPSGFNRTERFTSWFGLFPRTYDTQVISVGAVDRTNRRSIWTAGQPQCTEDSGSNFGDEWVDVAAPGTGILSTRDGGGVVELNGTSMATPHVSGLAALILAGEPGLTPAQVRTRVMSTASGRPVDSGLGAGNVDAFEATFNAGFESGGLNGWATTGTVDVVTRLGGIRPRQGDRMVSISSGPDNAVTTSTMSKRFTIDPAVLDDDSLIIRFDYNYLSEEFDEFVGTQFNDTFTAQITLPNGTVLPVAFESVNTTVFTPVTGINFPGGDSTVGQSGWTPARIEVPASSLAGASSFNLTVADQGDAIFDSVTLIDDIEVS
jgi:subtilisin family serine protease